MGWGSRYNTPLVIELKACVKQSSVLIRVFDLYGALCSGDNACYAIYECGQLFPSIELGGGLVFVARRQMAGKLPASFAMGAQADQQSASRIQEFMSTLHEAKAEWGIFHMLIAQTVLRRPILLAQPVEGRNTKTRYGHGNTITKIQDKQNTIEHNKEAIRVGIWSPSQRSCAGMSLTTTLTCPRHHVVIHCDCCRRK